MFLPTTPTSTTALSPGASRPDLAPVSSTRSCTVPFDAFRTVITNRLPAGTSIVSGVKRIPDARTSTVVVRPVGVMSSAAEVIGRFSATGSSAAPVAVATRTAANPAIARPLGRPGVRTGSTGRADAPPWRAAALARREARIAANRLGTKLASAPSTSIETTTRTRLGTGNAQTTRPTLVITRRVGPPASNTRLAARTGGGPAPRTTGTRYDGAPAKVCAAKPTASSGVNAVVT